MTLSFWDYTRIIELSNYQSSLKRLYGRRILENQEYREEDLPPEIAATARVTFGVSTYKSTKLFHHGFNDY